MEQETGALIMAGLGMTGGVVPFVVGTLIKGSPNEKDAYNVGAINGLIGGMTLGGCMAIAFALMNR